MDNNTLKTRVAEYWRRYRWHLSIIILLVACNLYTINRWRSERKSGAETLLKTKNRVWFIKQTYEDIVNGTGAHFQQTRDLLDTLVLNNLTRVQELLDQLPISDPK